MQEALMVISAAGLNFIFGLIWHVSVRKGKVLESVEIDDEPRKKDPTPHLIGLIGSLWVSYGMFVMLKHIRPNGIWEFLAVPVGTWLLIYVGLSSKHHAYNNKDGHSLVIDYIQDLIGLLIIAFVIY